ncbi:MAG: polysaccharide biosynthesis tyrosine autokinase [Sulfitobacter sp.]
MEPMRHPLQFDRAPASFAQQTVLNDAVDFPALFRSLRSGKWLISLICCLALILGAYYAFILVTPLYRATAVVILETNQDKIVDLQSVVGGLSGDTSEVNSEVEVLRARGLMAKVVDHLNLTTDPEFNSALQTKSLAQKAKDSVKATLGLPIAPPPLPPEEAAKREKDAVISTLLGAVTVRNIPLSLVFQITAETQSPEKSALIADTIVKHYILNQIEVKFDATEQATLWLSERVAALQEKLEQAEAKASAFSASTELISEATLRGLERQIKELRDRIANAQLAQTTAQTRVNAATAATRQSAELALARADQQLRALQTSERALNAQVSRQGEDLIALQQLTREAEATRILYEYFLTRLNETSAQQGVHQADSRILSNAVVPKSAASPRKPLILTMSGILGLMLGTALVLLKEMQRDNFRSAQDLEAATGYTVLGQIPMIPAASRQKTLQYLLEKPTSAAAEALRNLRTSLMMPDMENPPKVILSTSSLPGEGKTTNAIALAQNLLGLGKKVLLIEGDIRRRTLHEYFGEMPDIGIVSVLSGATTLQSAVHRPSNFGADILGGEATNINAADLFASEAFKALIQDARTQYDAVIIDTPPILVVPDARIIAQQADAIIFSVHWDKTGKQQVEDSLRLFHNSGQRITGLVLSQISAKRMRRYGGRAYASYGEKYYVN